MLKAYVDEKLSTSQKVSSALTTLYQLEPWSKFLVEHGKGSPIEFDAVTRAHVRAYTAVCGTECSVKTEDERKMYLKSFQRFVRGGTDADEYPDEVKWLVKYKKAGKQRAQRHRMKRVLKGPELQRIIAGQMHPMDRALMAVLYDSGARRTELSLLDLSSIRFEEQAAIIDLPLLDERDPGLKTGSRSITVIRSVPFLLRWMNDHPLKSKKSSPLWLSRSHENWMGRLSPDAIYEKVVKAGKTAALDFTVTPHVFRHSRATECALEGMTESEMRVHFGWSWDSDMPAFYTHVAHDQVHQRMLQRAGLKAKEESLVTVLGPAPCPTCGSANLVTDAFCAACHRPLTKRALEEYQARADEAMARRLVDLWRKTGVTQEALPVIEEVEAKFAAKASSAKKKR